MGAEEANIGLEISEQEVEVPGKGPVAVAVCALQVTKAREPNADPVHRQRHLDTERMSPQSPLEWRLTF